MWSLKTVDTVQGLARPDGDTLPVHVWVGVVAPDGPIAPCGVQIVNPTYGRGGPTCKQCLAITKLGKADSPQVGEFWQRTGRGLRIEILHDSDESVRVVFYGEDFPTLAWLAPTVIVERYIRMHTIEEAHAEALEYNALMTGPVAVEVLYAEDAVRHALTNVTHAPWVDATLAEYQEIMAEHGTCLVIGCHTQTLTLHICRDHLAGGV